MPRRFAAVVAALALAGCGSAQQHRSPASTPVPTASPPQLPVAVEGCSDAGSGWRSLRVAAPGLAPAVLGNGSIGIVLMNESGDNTCPWMGFARDLASHGFRAVVFNYGGGPARQREALIIARTLRRTGARHVVAVGASVGGRVAVQVAAVPSARRLLDGTVSLSGERAVGNLPDILPAARRVRVPILYVGARDDGYVSFGKETRQLYRATRGHKAILVLGSGGHGTDLVAGSAGARVRPRIIRFARTAAAGRA